MNAFLIESTISLCVLYLAYFFFLSLDSTHHFNRIFLLFSIVFSLAIPFITIEIIEEIAVSKNVFVTNQVFEDPIFVEEKINYFEWLGWILYTIVTLILTFKFVKNLYQIKRKINLNQQVDYQNVKLVLINEITVPYTFFNFIFVNKNDYLQQKIAPELLQHELVHCRQLHSLDVILVELLKTIFWFNPVFILYKKAIQLNHEFIADANVISKCDNIYNYQNLLLAKSNSKTAFNFTSSFNYQITKKRFIMMTKSTPIAVSIFKKVMLICIISLMLFSLSIETIAQQKPTSIYEVLVSENEKDKIRDAYFAGVFIKITDVQKSITINKVYENLTLEEKRKYLSNVPSKRVKKSPTAQEFENFKNSKKYAIWIDDKNIPNSKLSDYKATDFVYFDGSPVFKNAQSKKFPQPFQYHFYTDSYFEKNLANRHLKFSGKTFTVKLCSYQNGKKIKQTSKDEIAVEVDVRKTSENSIVVSEEKPQFQGGIKAFYEFIAKNFKISDDFDRKEKVVVDFIVEIDGSLSEIKTYEKSNATLRKEAERVMGISPKWIPGKIDGKPVRMQYVLPIQINNEAAISVDKKRN